jgi:hypothetical protein
MDSGERRRFIPVHVPHPPPHSCLNNLGSTYPAAAISMIRMINRASAPIPISNCFPTEDSLASSAFLPSGSGDQLTTFLASFDS